MTKSIIKCYFDCNPATSSRDNRIFKRIIETLTSNRCNVSQTILGSDLIYMGINSKPGASNIMQSKLHEIKNSEVFICEMSTVSATLVFEIFESLNQKKPVLVLYDEDYENPQDIAFMGNSSSLLFVESYNLQNLNSKISNFLLKAKAKIPITRFTVRLSEEHGLFVNYLKSKMNCSSRNDVIIKLLEGNMSKMDYKIDKLKE